MILAALLLTAAQAADPKVDCDDPMTQSEMNMCAYRSWQEADAEMNAAWKLASADMKQMDSDTDHGDGRPGYFAVLLEGQRAWLKFRDAHCESEGYLARGGSMEPLLYNGCRAQLTRQRTAQLNELIGWPN